MDARVTYTERMIYPEIPTEEDFDPAYYVIKTDFEYKGIEVSGYLSIKDYIPGRFNLNTIISYGCQLHRTSLSHELNESATLFFSKAEAALIIQFLKEANHLKNGKVSYFCDSPITTVLLHDAKFDFSKHLDKLKICKLTVSDT